MTTKLTRQITGEKEAAEKWPFCRSAEGPLQSPAEYERHTCKARERERERLEGHERTTRENNAHSSRTCPPAKVEKELKFVRHWGEYLEEYDLLSELNKGHSDST